MSRDSKQMPATSKKRFAINIFVTARYDCFVLDSTLHAIEHKPFKDDIRLPELIPIRFVFRNKLGNDDKLLLGFDAYVLSQALGCEIETGKIIHGDNGAVLYH